MEALWGLLGVAIGSTVTIVLQVVNLRHQALARQEEYSRLASERREGQLREACDRLLTAFNVEEVRRMHTFVDKYYRDREADAAVMHRVVDVYGPLRLELQRAELESFPDDVLEALRRFDSSLDKVLGDSTAAVGMPKEWERVQSRRDELMAALRQSLQQP